MTIIRNSVVALAALTLGAATANAQSTTPTTRVSVAADSKLQIEGTSNLHDWSCEAQKLEAAIDMNTAAAASMNVAAPNAVQNVEVRIPVKSLHCNHAGMDGNMYKALKADEAPQISYILASLQATATGKDGITLHTTGTLTIAGKANTISMDVSAVRLPDGTLRASGSVPVKMTDFGISPPTAIFGRLRCGDEVKVSFVLDVSPKTIAEAAAASHSTASSQ